MTEIVKFGGAGTGLMSRDDLAKSLNNIATAAPRVGGEYQFLKMERELATGSTARRKPSSKTARSGR